MSFANEKGGYQKTLEVSRENSNRTQTMLQTDFLKKGENYILNITDFVTSTSPPMNLLTGPFLTVPNSRWAMTQTTTIPNKRLPHNRTEPGSNLRVNWKNFFEPYRYSKQPKCPSTPTTFEGTGDTRSPI